LAVVCRRRDGGMATGAYADLERVVTLAGLTAGINNFGARVLRLTMSNT